MLTTPIIDIPPADQRLGTLLLAHGAGAPMDSEFMQQLAVALSGQGIAVVRFEFPYMQARRASGKRSPPNPMPRLLDTFREQWRQVSQTQSGPLLLGGKSMGGRVASMLADELGASGLVCFGYPFHPPGKPEKTRVEHLAELITPALMVQGTRDAFGKPDEVARYALSPAVQLHWLETADHDFKPLKSSAQNQTDMIQQAARTAGLFCEGLLRHRAPGAIHRR